MSEQEITEADWRMTEDRSREEFQRIYADHFQRGRFHADEVQSGRNPVYTGCTCRNCAPARGEAWRI